VSFKTNLEAAAQADGQYPIPPELEEAYFYKQGICVWPLGYRTMPDHLIEKIKLLWHLDNVAAKSQRE
jgi:hypothetical protein